MQGINDLVTPFLAVFLGEHFAAGGPALAGGMDAWDVATLSNAARPALRLHCAVWRVALDFSVGQSGIAGPVVDSVRTGSRPRALTGLRRLTHGGRRPSCA